MRTLAFAGGGTAGHVVPNLALADELRPFGWRFHYIGSRDGLEERMVQREQMPYSAISTAKFRRHQLRANLASPGKVLRGVLEAYEVLGRVRPDVVFATGGYGSYPLVIAAWMRRLPVVVHECDITPGLANRLARPFTTVTTFTFESTRVQLPASAVYTGPLYRKEIRELAAARKKSPPTEPLLVAYGGSQGAARINSAVRSALPELLKHYEVIHVCGKGKLAPELGGVSGYEQLEFVDALPRILARATVAICRAGSNSLWELIALGVPHIAVPLSPAVSRGDQVQNAAFFDNAGCTRTVPDESFDAPALLAALRDVERGAPGYVSQMNRLSDTESPVSRLRRLVEDLAD